MNENEKRMIQGESLTIISGLINHAKNRISDTGHLYLLRGFVISICCITQFIILYFFKNPDVYYVWYTTWLVVIYQYQLLLLALAVIAAWIISRIFINSKI